MHNEWSRFKSFERFPVESNARPLRLAQNGFFYQGNGEEAECAFCGIVNAAWAESETVNEIHARLSRACPFVSGQATANVPIHMEETLNQQPICSSPSSRTCNTNTDRRSSNDDNNHLTTSAKGNTVEKELNALQQEARHSSSGNSNHCGTTSTPTERAEEGCFITHMTKYPQYSSRAERMKSFTSWSYSHIVQPQDLCDAGLFFVGKLSETYQVL